MTGASNAETPSAAARSRSGGGDAGRGGDDPVSGSGSGSAGRGRPRHTGGLILGAGGGCFLLIAVLTLTLTGVVDPSTFLAGSDRGPAAEGGALEECLQGADATERDECLVEATVESEDSLWARLGPSADIDFVEPEGQVFAESVQTDCGAATVDVGPFYCSSDTTLYVDVSFFDALTSQYGADGGQLAKMYVVAHEYGHHIQHLSGTLLRADLEQTGPQSDGVRIELQADCYAGVWAKHASSTTDDQGHTMLTPLSEDDIDSALSAATAVGDDHIQGTVAGGEVRPETWTHGSSEQRRDWFTTGYEQGTVASCDTFAADRV